VAYFNLKLYKEAEKEYLEAIRLDPFSRHTFFHYLNLGVLYGAMGQEDKALSAYENAIVLTPDMPLAYRFTGNIYYRRGDLRTARKFWNRALELNPACTAEE